MGNNRLQYVRDFRLILLQDELKANIVRFDLFSGEGRRMLSCASPNTRNGDLYPLGGLQIVTRMLKWDLCLQVQHQVQQCQDCEDPRWKTPLPPYQEARNRPQVW